MNKKHTLLPVAVLVTSLSACTPPEKDIPGLTSGIDAAVAGHYGQSMYHEEQATEKLEDANRVLQHWKDGHYWNIDERQQALDDAKSAADHRLESEKELCQWLTEVHGPNHHMAEATQHAAAYFKTGSAVPYRTDDRAISVLGKYLQMHPDASADVIAYTDTVGSTASNETLSENRAAHVSQMLVANGAKPEQLRVKAMGEAEGPDNTPNQQNRTVAISTVHPEYVDCPNLK
jgi:outer membrane protein OmpA-like peptidoglycan-associated protein